MFDGIPRHALTWFWSANLAKTAAQTTRINLSRYIYSPVNKFLLRVHLTQQHDTSNIQGLLTLPKN